MLEFRVCQKVYARFNIKLAGTNTGELSIKLTHHYKRIEFKTNILTCLKYLTRKAVPIYWGSLLLL